MSLLLAALIGLAPPPTPTPPPKPTVDAGSKRPKQPEDDEKSEEELFSP